MQRLADDVNVLDELSSSSLVMILKLAEVVDVPVVVEARLLVALLLQLLAMAKTRILRYYCSYFRQQDTSHHYLLEKWRHQRQQQHHLDDRLPDLLVRRACVLVVVAQLRKRRRRGY